MGRIVGSVICVAVFMVITAGFSACSRASASVTEWHGLCIPSARITSLQGSAFGEAIAHMKTDTSVAPAVTVEFSSKELAQAVPNYIAEIPDKAGTNMGSIVSIQPLPDAARPGGAAHLGEGYKNLWHLTGDSKGSSVKKLPGINLYRVTAPKDQKYDTFFELVTKNLRRMADRPVPPLREWYVADCGRDNELGYTCNRHLFTPDFYIEYNFAKPNVSKLPELDKFFKNKLKEWRAACESQ